MASALDQCRWDGAGLVQMLLASIHFQMCIEYDSIGFKLTTLFRAIAKRLEQRKGVLPQHWCWTIHLCRHAGILHWKTNRMHMPTDGMLYLNIHRTGLNLRIPVDRLQV